MRNIKKNFAVILFLLAIPIAVFAYGIYKNLRASAKSVSAISKQQPQAKTFTAEELKKYDGSNPNLPIYLAYEGNIYDVSAGKEYYVTGGSYHYLAGRDSTAELNMAGGDIIKRKYPVIGTLK